MFIFIYIKKELKLISESEIKNKIKKVKNDEHLIDITLNKELISENFQTDIHVLVHILPNFPFTQPKIYTKNSVKYN